jgi:hypothetical protein
MRTTLNIDPPAFDVIRRYAEEQNVSLGQAASDLIQRGAESLPQFRTRNGWVQFELVGPGVASLSADTVKNWEEEQIDEEAGRAFSS